MPVVFTRSVGRPRVGWLNENARWLYEKEHLDEEYNHKNETHWTWVENLPPLKVLMKVKASLIVNEGEVKLTNEKERKSFHEQASNL